jgi:ankyrin repeat protein
MGLCHASVTELEPIEVSTLRIAVRSRLPTTCQWLLSINTVAQISSTLTKPGIDSLFLDEAITYGCVDVPKVLLDARADMNQKWKYLSPPPHTAAFLGNKEVVKMLILSGADVNIEADGKTPIDEVIEYGRSGIEKILRDAGGRPSSRRSVNVRSPQKLLK